IYKFLVRGSRLYPEIFLFLGFCNEFHAYGYDFEYIAQKWKSKKYIGYWQSEHFFHKHILDLKEFFIPKNVSEQANLLAAKILESQSSLSIHIRRGDYIKNKTATLTHGVCSLEYYKKALNKIRDLAMIRDVFIFSDDIFWCKENIETLLSKKYNIYYSEDLSQEEDLWLMSLANHHIIANSSFSWWGAYLGTSASQIVIYPTPWYDITPKNTYIPIVNHWINVDKHSSC
ncbi:alpha-1,2-fucosyltransferase, partial [Escherichia coli]|nr:alpha-1,2-fucosyltransferase [Escherichia coli]